jgi:succinate dehydrogenase / fumarate reductase flavoprotein subunit
MKRHDVIVVGGGLAGLRAGLEINKRNMKCAVLSKIHPVRSHSVAAQGGINASLGNHYRGGHDNPNMHAFDTVKGSDYLADQDAAIRLGEDAVMRVCEMENWGTPFSRTTEGKIAQRPFGGAGFPRTCYAADRTGQVLLHTLYEQAVRFKYEAERQELTIYDEWFVTSLVVDGGECKGVIALDMKTGELEAFGAEAVIFATGGAGRIYGKTSNALCNTGMGMAMPYRAGIPLKDMEFIQFHPTTIAGTNILMTEGCRGEGGYLINKDGERFLAKYDDSKKAMEVAPRDIVSRNITKEIIAGNGIESHGTMCVHLDLRHLGEERIAERLPGIRSICMNFLGIDPVFEPIPIQPAQHYTMGGIHVDTKCQSPVAGFFAAGECSCVSVHGANRLGGNSLLETIVFGAIAGDSAFEYVSGKETTGTGDAALEAARAKDEERIRALFASKGTESHAQIKAEMGDAMVEGCGIFRDGEKLAECLEKVMSLKERYKNIRLTSSGTRWNFDLVWALELGGSLDVAEVIVAGALARTESRGAQARTDYPKRDDANWLKHTLAHYTSDGPRLEYGDVRLGVWEPKERKY